jgi:hypothetical protein
MQVQDIAAIACLGFFLAGAGSVLAEDNPLAPAEQGKIACFKPKVGAKTCWGILRYKKLQDLKYEVATRARFRNTTDFEMRSTSTVTLKANRICSILVKAELDGAHFFHLGDEVIKQDLDDLRAQVEDQFQNRFGVEYCDEFTAPAADGLIKITTYVDGTPLLPGSGMETMKWVSPDEGYKLR